MFEQFKNPPRKYSPIPFWFLNERLEPDRLRWQVREMAKQHVYGAVMHARPGLLTPYLSDEWFEMIGHIVDEAERQGMEMVIYDEYPWHSGMAEWRVPKEHPDYRIRALDRLEQVIEGPQTLDWRFGESLPKEQFDGVVRVTAVPLDGEGRLVGGGVDISRYLQGDRLVWQAPEGKHLVAVFYERLSHNPYGDKFGQFPVSDLMHPQAIRRFIELTHKEYEARWKETFGRAITAVFTDEPPSATPGWSRVFLSEFRRRKGYDLQDHLPLLWHDGGALTGKVRFDYYDVVGALYEENYFGQIERWGKENGVLTIGHLLLEETLLFHARFMGDYFRTMRRQDAPGIDYIFPGVIPPVVPKMAASVANIYGKERVMSECFALTGWAFTFQHMKWMTDWQLVNGVNYFVPHAFFYAITEDEPIPKIPDDLGFRWYDCPPSMFFQQPYWQFYSVYADYLRRCCYLLTQGELVTDIAVYYPIDTVFADFVPDKAYLDMDFRTIPGGWPTADYLWDGPPAAQTDAHFRALCDGLRKERIDYDIVDDDTLREATIEGGRLVGRTGRGYRMLILPRASWIPADVYERIEAFWQAGGIVIATGDVPQYATEGPEQDRTVVFTTERLFQSVRPAQNAQGAAVTQTGKRTYFTERPTPALSEHIRSLEMHDIETSYAPLQAMHRKVEGRDVYYLVNHSDKASGSIEVALKGEGRPIQWNPLEGSERPIWGWRSHGEWVVATLTFAPYESTFVLLQPTDHAPQVHVDPELEVLEVGRREDDAAVVTLRPSEPGEFTVSFQTGRGVVKRWVTVEQDDVRTIPVAGPWRVRLHRGDESPERLRDLPPKPSWDEIPTEHEWDALGPWEEKGLLSFSGLAIYETQIELGALDGLDVLIDLGEVGIVASVEVNGERVGSALWAPYAFDVTPYVKKGKNLLRVETANTLANAIQASYSDHRYGHYARFPEGRLRSGLIGPVRLSLRRRIVETF